MRVAVVSNTLPPEGSGGAEAYVAELAPELAARGHEVLLLSGAAAGVDGVRHVRLPGLPPLARRAPTARKALWHARDQWLPRVERALGRELAGFRPDVVHTHEIQGLSSSVFAAVAEARLPHVHTAHDFNLLCTRVTMTRAGRFCGGRCLECRAQRALRMRALRRRLDRLVAVSELVLRRHLDAGAVEPRLAVAIPHGARPGRARVRSAGGPALVVGFLGSLEPHKGVPTLLEAFRDAPPAWRLRVAGRGTLEPLVRAAAAADGRIDFEGHVSGEPKERLLEELDVVVVPSDWEEPAGLVPVEAAVRGLPAVTSGRGGLAEAPHAGLFEAGSAPSLLAALTRLAAPGRLEAASRELLARAGEWSWDTHADAVERVLAEAAAGRPDGP